MKPSVIKEAKEMATRLMNDLKDFPGEIYTKQFIRAYYDISFAVSIYTWEYLKPYGYTIKHQKIIVPQLPPVVEAAVSSGANPDSP